MEKNISIDELNSICKKINELNDRMSNHDQNGRKLYEEIGWIWRNDAYITNIAEENLIISRRNQQERERFIEEMNDKQASEMRKYEESIERNHIKNNETDKEMDK